MVQGDFATEHLISAEKGRRLLCCKTKAGWRTKDVRDPRKLEKTGREKKVLLQYTQRGGKGRRKRKKKKVVRRQFYREERKKELHNASARTRKKSPS